MEEGVEKTFGSGVTSSGIETLSQFLHGRSVTQLNWGKIAGAGIAGMTLTGIMGEDPMELDFEEYFSRAVGGQMESGQIKALVEAELSARDPAKFGFLQPSQLGTDAGVGFIGGGIFRYGSKGFSILKSLHYNEVTGYWEREWSWVNLWGRFSIANCLGSLLRSL